MKKIMFNDKFGLTQAVLEGRKTMTRRVVSPRDSKRAKAIASPLKCYFYIDALFSRDQVGDVVAIAQSYKDINELGIVQTKPTQGNEYIWFGNDGGLEYVWAENHAGWKNKMFVKAELMPHHIKITNIRVERLQDISDDDCLREGIRKWDKGGNPLGPSYDFVNSPHGYATPREAFAALIDKVSGRGTWDSNPMVWVYEFELVD